MERLQTGVLVIGGGTAGITAAFAAAEEGASVIIVERDTGLGGVGVRAGVPSYYLGSRGGIQEVLDREIVPVNASMGRKTGGFSPESKGQVITEYIAKLGIQVIYEAVASKVIMEGSRVRGVIVESGRNTYEILAHTVIDSSGNGDIAGLAGASYTLGRDWDGALHNYSLVPRFVDENNQLRWHNFDVGWLDPTDPADVSRAYRTGRAYLWREGEHPANTHFVAAGPQLGVREGRLIVGDYRLTQDDLLLDRRFDDAVMRCYAHYENHAFDYANESVWAQNWVVIMGMWRLPFGGQVPYRCFLPRGIDGLLIGCRALSQDHDSAMMLRMQRDLHKIGEVAGTAAALCVKNGVMPRQLDVRLLQQRLIDRGVLREEELTSPRDPKLKFKGESAEDRLRPLIQGPQAKDVSALIQRLGGEEEPAALWWLLQFGDASLQPLLTALPRAEGSKRDSIAIALGLLKHPACIPILEEAFQRQESARQERNPNPRTEPLWLIAAILLGRMKVASIAPAVASAMRSEKRTITLLYMLHYLINIADQLSDPVKKQIAEDVSVMLSNPKLGEDFPLYGSGAELPCTEDTRSMRWNLELNAGLLLEKLGSNEKERIWNRYKNDYRGYVRLAAERISSRLDQTADARPTGSGMQTLGAYDAVVVGGGLAGVAAAYTLASEGWNIAVIEPTGVLGREITRAYSNRIHLPDHHSPGALRAFQTCVKNRMGWFDGQVDPVAASLAFDDLLQRHHVHVFFHIWPSRLLTYKNRVTGIEAASLSGQVRLEAPVVIDASSLGKLSASQFGSRPAAPPHDSMIRLIYSNITEELPREYGIRLNNGEALKVQCNRTCWPNEWRVTLSANQPRNRADWQLVLGSALPAMREQIPALQTGVLAHLADDPIQSPPHRIDTGTGVISGLVAAGAWMEGYPYNPFQEEAMITNAFLLGERAAQAARSIE